METPEYRIPEVMRRLMSEDKKLTKEVNVNGDQVQHIHHLSQQHRFPQVEPKHRLYRHHPTQTNYNIFNKPLFFQTLNLFICVFKPVLTLTIQSALLKKTHIKKM